MEKHAVIIAGPNGVGKTTFAKEYCREHKLKYISADMIAERLNPENLQKVAIKAGRLFFKEIYECIEKGNSFVVESTLSGISFKNVIKNLKDAEYSVSIIFVFLLSPENCIVRIDERVRQHGHWVPEKDVIRRFYRSIKNFWNLYRHIVDDWYLICNSTEQFVEVALGQKNDYSTSDEKTFSNFLEIVDKLNE